MNPADVLFFEDFAVGQSFELGTHAVTKDEIIDFAKKWDPQPFHLDDAAGEESPFGGLIASGWHTVSALMSLCAGLLNRSAGMGSPGVDEVRWWQPVRPGDALTGRTTVLEVKASQSKADRGTVLLLSELFNQDGKRVLSMKGAAFFARRR
ncbi:MAG: dehydratase [Dehalococcoidia bacterium]|nr:dehydratase [Dehalococcoidia bacterium]